MKKIKTLRRIRQELVELITLFPKDKKEEQLFGNWSLKDTLSHLSNWYQHDIRCLNALKKGVEPHWEPDINKFNKKGIELRKNWTWEQVYKEFIDLGDTLFKEYDTLPKGLWEKKIWKNRKHTPTIFVEDDICHFKNEHIVEIKKILKKF